MSIYSSSKIILEKIFESIKLEYEPGKTLIAYPGPMDTNFDNNSLFLDYFLYYGVQLQNVWNHWYS